MKPPLQELETMVRSLREQGRRGIDIRQVIEVWTDDALAIIAELKVTYPDLKW